MNDLSRLLKLQGRLTIDTVLSAALAGNPLGDPAERPLAVYTPPGYDPEGSTRYPVLYCLHGYTGDVAGLVSGRAWETNVVQWVDRLIAIGKMPPVLLAIVDGFTRLGGSQYVDSVHNGNYATYTIAEVIPQVDRTYRTIPQAGGRAVFGKSSGGFGALHLSLAFPGTFAALASHSGDLYFGYAHLPSFPTAQRTLETFYAILAADPSAEHNPIAEFVAVFEGMSKRPQAYYQTIEMLGYGAAYSPAGATAFDIDLPWDRKTGELRADVFARWLSFDPCERVTSSLPALQAMRLRYIDCGRRDEYGLDIGARILVSRMREAGLEVQHEEFDDDHRNVGYRYSVSLPLLASVLDRE